MITVVAAASTIDLCTLAEIKAELEISDSSSDSFLGGIITQASAQAAGYCDRVFGQETVRERVRAYDTPYIQLSRYPIIGQIASVKYGDDDPITVLASEYAIEDNAAGILRYKAGSWGSSYAMSMGALGGIAMNPEAKLYEVEYTAGYAISGGAIQCPADLKRAVIELVKVAWFARSRDPYLESLSIPDVIQKSWGAGAGRASMSAGGLPPLVQQTLNRYRRLV